PRLTDSSTAQTRYTTHPCSRTNPGSYRSHSNSGTAYRWAAGYAGALPLACVLLLSRAPAWLPALPQLSHASCVLPLLSVWLGIRRACAAAPLLPEYVPAPARRG